MRATTSTPNGALVARALMVVVAWLSQPRPAASFAMPGRMAGATTSKISRAVCLHRRQSSMRMGEVGFSFSVAGLLFPYHLGVAEELKKAGQIQAGTPLAGASGGALAAAFTALDLEPEIALSATCRICDNIRASQKSSRGQLGRLLRQELVRVLPDDAHTRLSSWKGGIRIGVTLLRPFPTAAYVQSFESKQDLISVLVCSCHIPFWTSNWPLARCQGTLGVDGYFSNVATFGCPPTSADATVCVCPLTASRVFAKQPMEPGGRVGSAAAVEAQGWGAGVISPELLPREGRGRPQELLPVALEPPPDNSLVQTLYEGGRRDARAWLALHSATAS